MIDRRQLLVSSAALVVATALRPKNADAFPTGPGLAHGNGFAHPEWFTNSDWLRTRLGTKGVHVIALQSREDFDAGSIPTAVQLDQSALALFDTSELSVDAWRSEISVLLGQLGIARDSTVIAYGGDDLYAARIWWSFRQVGHADVRILDGGLAAWSAAGGELAISASPPIATSTVPSPVVADEASIATLDEVIAALDTGNALFVDARKAEDYAEGHIPGAISIPSERNADASGAGWKPAAELSRVYAGVSKDALVIPYCVGGVRSAATAFALRQLGYERVALFTGSWKEWSAHPELPITEGAAP